MNDQDCARKPGGEAIEHNFKYHPPTGSALLAHATVRAKARDLADWINKTLPEGASREKALAITKVEEAMFWANAGIARHSGA